MAADLKQYAPGRTEVETGSPESIEVMSKVLGQRVTGVRIPNRTDPDDGTVYIELENGVDLVLSVTDPDQPLMVGLRKVH